MLDLFWVNASGGDELRWERIMKEKQGQNDWMQVRYLAVKRNDMLMVAVDWAHCGIFLFLFLFARCWRRREMRPTRFGGVR